MVTLLVEINKPESVTLEIDLGFSKMDFLSSYRKRFHSSIYADVSVTMKYTKEEFLLFETFFIETLKYGTLPFEADFGIGTGIIQYELVEKPSFNNFEADLYTVSLKLLEISIAADTLCIEANACLEDLLSNLQGVNTYVSNNIVCPELEKDAGICMINLTNLILGDVNEYSEQRILV